MFEFCQIEEKEDVCLYQGYLKKRNKKKGSRKENYVLEGLDRAPLQHCYLQQNSVEKHVRENLINNI
jgi:hypothetical protein